MKRKPEILHLANDEKFVFAAKFLFEKAFPGSNHFLLIKPPADPPPRYVARQPGIETVVLGEGAMSLMRTKLNNADAVVLHGIDQVKGTLLDQTTDKEKFSGIIFGAELYNKSITGDDYLGEETRGEKRRIERFRPIDIIKEVYRFMAYRGARKAIKNIPLQDVLQQLTFIGTHYPGSLEKWKQRGVLSTTADTFHFSYYPLELIIPDNNLQATGKNILIGNSASFTNNHLEMMYYLKNLGIENKGIKVPLSYGNSRYAKKIEKVGKSLFGESFTAVKKYLTYEDYNELIAECEVVIMNHRRSQGLGSTLAALYLGARVFLNETDLYRYFISIGCKVFSIQKELENELINGSSLKPEVIERNRRLLRAQFSEEVIVSSIQTSFEKRYHFDEK